MYPMHLLAATITGKQLHYDTLTAEIVYNHLWDLRASLINPTHLFMTEAGIRELTEIAIAIQGIEEPPKNTALKMYLGMHVVVLPGLPENTLLMGTLRLSDN